MRNGLNVDSKGNKRYYKNNYLHRESGPAIILANGTRVWYLNGKRHREAGPAVISADGNQWWLNGNKYSFKEYVNCIFPEDSPERTLFVLKWSGS